MINVDYLKNAFVFKNLNEFKKYSEKNVNGCTEKFLNDYYYGNIYFFCIDNRTNKGCFNCFRCKDCTGCVNNIVGKYNKNSVDCSNCVNCKFCTNCKNCYRCYGVKNMSDEEEMTFYNYYY